jgi:hypothetical protein
MKADLSLTQRVKAPAEKVFAEIVNWPAQSEWMVGTKVWVTKNQGVGVGGEFAAFTGIGKLGFIDPMRITHWDPPHEVSVLHLGNFVKGTGLMKVEKIDDDTSDFIWSESLQLPLGIFGFIGYKLIEPFFKMAIKSSLKKFAQIVEKSSY